MLSVLSDCMTCPLSRLSIFNPLPPGGTSSAVTIQGPKTAGAIEVLAHVPLRGLALKFAHRAFVAAGVSGDARICGRRV